MKKLISRDLFLALLVNEHSVNKRDLDFDAEMILDDLLNKNKVTMNEDCIVTATQKMIDKYNCLRNGC